MGHVLEKQVIEVWKDDAVKYCSECKRGAEESWLNEASYYVTGYDYEDMRPFRGYMCNPHLEGSEYRDITIKSIEQIHWAEWELDAIAAKYTAHKRVKDLFKRYPTLRVFDWMSLKERHEMHVLQRACVKFGKGYFK